jgi:DNA-binding NtrC family response regulator
MTTQLTQTRPLRVLVADPRADEYQATDGEVELQFCTTGREALRHADEPLDYVLLSANLADLDFEDVAEMFNSMAPEVGLIVFSENTSIQEEAIARQIGAIMYRQRALDLDWLTQLRPRRSHQRGPAPRLTLDWHQRPSRRPHREHAAAH